MSEFTYKFPEGKSVFNALIKMLNSKNQKEIIELITGGHIVFVGSDDFSQKYSKLGRWDAYCATAHIYVRPECYDRIKTEENEVILLKCINDIVPKDAGYDFYEIDFSIELDCADVDLLSQVMADVSNVAANSLRYITPELIEKGREMAESYALLYVIENSLRIFLIKTFELNYGPNYMDQIKITSDIRKNVDSRKKDEKDKKWLSVRGDSDIYYMDFIDLRSLVCNNYAIFQTYFSDLEAFKSKMNEMYQCRNKIGHGSYLDISERNLLGVYYTWIMKCIQ